MIMSKNSNNFAPFPPEPAPNSQLFVDMLEFFVKKSGGMSNSQVEEAKHLLQNQKCGEKVSFFKLIYMPQRKLVATYSPTIYGLKK